MKLLSIAILLVASTTGATPSATPGAPHGGKLVHTVLEPLGHDRAMLTVVLDGKSREGDEVSLPIRLAADVTAVGLSLSMAGEHVVASAVRSEAAEYTYDRVVAEIKDPALLERTADGQLRLRVFPVRRGKPATVTIVLSTDAATVARVDRGTSLIAVPADAARFANDDELYDPYADYWPAHEDARVAADW